MLIGQSVNKTFKLGLVLASNTRGITLHNLFLELHWEQSKLLIFLCKTIMGHNGPTTHIL